MIFSLSHPNIPSFIAPERPCQTIPRQSAKITAYTFFRAITPCTYSTTSPLFSSLTLSSRPNVTCLPSPSPSTTPNLSLTSSTSPVSPTAPVLYPLAITSKSRFLVVNKIVENAVSLATPLTCRPHRPRSVTTRDAARKTA